MALAITNRVANGQDADATSFNFSVAAPSSNCWLIVDVVARRGAGPITPTVSGGSLTYNQEAVVTSSTNDRLTRFTAWVGTSPGAYTLTVDFAGNTMIYCHCHVNEITGGDTSDIFVNSNSLTATGASTTASVTLNAFGSTDNRPLLAVQINGNKDVVPEGGHTQIAESVNDATFVRLYTGWHDTSADTTPSATWTGSETYTAIASEIKVAVTTKPGVIYISNQAVQRASRW